MRGFERSGAVFATTAGKVARFALLAGWLAVDGGRFIEGIDRHVQGKNREARINKSQPNDEQCDVEK